jgi:hypothetical protein
MKPRTATRPICGPANAICPICKEEKAMLNETTRRHPRTLDEAFGPYTSALEQHRDANRLALTLLNDPGATDGDREIVRTELRRVLELAA